MKRTLSKYISEYEMDDRTVGLFSSVFMTKKFIDRESWSKVKRSHDFTGIPAAHVEYLEDGGMIVVEGEDEGRLDELRAGRAMCPSIEVLYLFVTNTCNMRCKYCVVDKEHAQTATGSFMTEEIAGEALELFLANTKTEKPAIQLWGGEPLSNWVVFEFAVERARELESKYSKAIDISAVTNGTLLTKEIAAFLKRNRVRCSISVDGLKEQHDAMRVYADGRGTYGDIRNNLKLLEDAGVGFGVSLAIGAHNVDLLPAVGRDLCRALAIKHIGTCLLMKVDTANPAHTSEVRAARQLIELFKTLSQDGIFEDTMMKKVRSFAFAEAHLHDCAAGGRQIAVMPNGDIGICHYAATAGRWIIGNVRDAPEGVFCNTELADWARRSPINMPQCSQCPGLVMCGGGCPYEAHEKKGDLWELDERFCTHCKESIKWMMEETYKRRGPTKAGDSAVLMKMKDVVAQSGFTRAFMPPVRETAATVTDAELQRTADAFRRRHGLTSAEATRAWMRRHGITMKFFEEFLESCVLLGLYGERPEEEAHSHPV